MATRDARKVVFLASRDGAVERLLYQLLGNRDDAALHNATHFVCSARKVVDGPQLAKMVSWCTTNIQTNS